jgi:O-antigen ligase
MFRGSRFTNLWNASFSIAWSLSWLLLPVTSFPLLSRLMGYPTVSPASLIPLAWLALWLVSFLRKNGPIPRESIPLLFFCSVSLLASAYAVFLPVPSFKGQPSLGEEITALVTLTIGVMFYLVTAAWLFQSSEQFSKRLTGTLRLLSISGVIIVLWAGIQAIYIFLFRGHFPASLLAFHRFFSIRDSSSTRLTGFAYEPSWLAHQLNVLYLPFWLAATLQGWSAFRYRFGRCSVENLLLGLGGVIVLLSSRIGALSFFLVFLIAFIHFSIGFVQRRRGHILSDRAFRSRADFRPVLWRNALMVFLLLALYGIVALAILYGVAQVNPRLARLFQFPVWARQQQSSLDAYLVFRYLAFAERYVYWVTGWRIFSLHPILGVGLGNAGFFFHSELPAYGWNLPEVMDYYYRAAYLPNIKNFWIRLLAETGIVGFASFLAWYTVMWASARFLRSQAEPLYRVVGWAGLFTLVAFITEGFSMDTFALPYLWVALGIVSASAAMARKRKAAPVDCFPQ